MKTIDLPGQDRMPGNRTLVTVSCPKCQVQEHTEPEEYGKRQCVNGHFYLIRSFPTTNNPSGREWAASLEPQPEPCPMPGCVEDHPPLQGAICAAEIGHSHDGSILCHRPYGHDGAHEWQPSERLYATATDAMKAARDEHSDELAAHVPPVYAKQSKLRHWWESKKGEWRNRLIVWLGIEAVAFNLNEWIGEARCQDALIRKLRKDFDDATQANVDIFRNYDHRITQTEQNVHALTSQVHTTMRNQGRMLAALRTVPMNQVAWRKYQETERINAERALKKQRKLAGSIGPVESVSAIDPVPEVVTAVEVPHSD